MDTRRRPRSLRGQNSGDALVGVSGLLLCGLIVDRLQGLGDNVRTIHCTDCGAESG